MLIVPTNRMSNRRPQQWEDKAVYQKSFIRREDLIFVLFSPVIRSDVRIRYSYEYSPLVP
jgi:surfactin synthase thioesterase subunit